MHQSWVSLCLTVLSAALILPACHSSAPVIDPGGGPAADPLATGLPGLSGLSQPERSVSLKGPGFMTLDQHAILASAHMTPGTDPLIGLDAASGLARAIEGYSGLPTQDQSRQIDWAFEDVTKLVEEFNGILQTEMPAFYSELTAQMASPALRIAPPVRKR